MPSFVSRMPKAALKGLSYVRDAVLGILLLCALFLILPPVGWILSLLVFILLPVIGFLLLLSPIVPFEWLTLWLAILVFLGGTWLYAFKCRRPRMYVVVAIRFGIALPV